MFWFIFGHLFWSFEGVGWCVNFLITFFNFKDFVLHSALKLKPFLNQNTYGLQKNASVSSKNDRKNRYFFARKTQLVYKKKLNFQPNTTPAAIPFFHSKHGWFKEKKLQLQTKTTRKNVSIATQNAVGFLMFPKRKSLKNGGGTPPTPRLQPVTRRP